MSIDDNLDLTRHLVTEGRLSFFRTEKATILFGREGDGECRKICHITFNKKNGAIYAQFTYFRTDPGVVGLVRSIVGDRGTFFIDWMEGGKVATNLVKYSHPPDGRSHFSQDGSHRTQFWHQSLDLYRDTGPLFEIHAFHLEPFETLRKSDVGKKRLFLPFRAGGQPSGLTLAAEWASLEEISRTADPGQETAGPVALIPRRGDGKLFKAALLAPPVSAPLGDHILLLNLHPIEPPEGITQPMLFFFGGWLRQQSYTPGSEVSFLSFWYPVEDPATIATRLGIADFPRPDWP